MQHGIQYCDAKRLNPRRQAKDRGLFEKGTELSEGQLTEHRAIRDFQVRIRTDDR